MKLTSLSIDLLAFSIDQRVVYRDKTHPAKPQYFANFVKSVTLTQRRNESQYASRRVARIDQKRDSKININ